MKISALVAAAALVFVTTSVAAEEREECSRAEHIRQSQEEIKAWWKRLEAIRPQAVWLAAHKCKRSQKTGKLYCDTDKLPPSITLEVVEEIEAVEALMPEAMMLHDTCGPNMIIMSVTYRDEPTQQRIMKMKP